MQVAAHLNRKKRARFPGRLVQLAMTAIRMALTLLAAGLLGALAWPAEYAGSLRADDLPRSVSELAKQTRVVSVKVPGGHLLGARGNRAPYTLAMSDSMPAPKLVSDGDGRIYLAYSDGQSNARVLRLNERLGVEREVLKVQGQRMADVIGHNDGFALLLTEFDEEPKGNYVNRRHHTAHIERYDENGRALFRTRIVGTREYKQAGDQGIDTTFGTFGLAYDSSNDTFAAYFSTYRRWDDGITHQSEYLAFVHAASGKRVQNDRGRPLGFTWNVSHSFRPRFAYDGKRLVMATAGDAYPRGFVVQTFEDGRLQRKVPIKIAKAKPGETYQHVPVSTGDVYARKGRSLVALDSAVNRQSYDIALIPVADGKVGKPRFITNTSRVRERIPRLVPLDAQGDALLVFWMSDRGSAKNRWSPAMKAMRLEAAIVDVHSRTLAQPSSFGSPGQFQMRGAARTFRLPDGRVGWVNDVAGTKDRLDIVVIGKASGGEPDDELPLNPNPDLEEDGEDSDEVKIDPSLNGPLLNAIYGGDDTVALKYLKRGADPNAKSGDWTALLYAAYFGRTEVALELIRRKADPTAAVSGWTSLQMAQARGHKRIVQALRTVQPRGVRSFRQTKSVPLPGLPPTQSVRQRGSVAPASHPPAQSPGEALRQLGAPRASATEPLDERE